MQALGQVWGRVDPHAPDLKETATPLDIEPRLYGAQLAAARLAQAPKAALSSAAIFPRARFRACCAISRCSSRVGQSRISARASRAPRCLRRFGRDITGANMSELYAPATFARRRDWLLEAHRTAASPSSTISSCSTAIASRSVSS